MLHGALGPYPMTRSRIHWLRRSLLKLAMWGDPALDWDNQDEAEAGGIVEDAKHGSIEAELRLRHAVYARKYLRGGKP